MTTLDAQWSSRPVVVAVRFRRPHWRGLRPCSRPLRQDQRRRLPALGDRMSIRRGTTIQVHRGGTVVVAALTSYDIYERTEALAAYQPCSPTSVRPPD